VCVCVCKVLDSHFVCVRERGEEESEGAQRKAESKREKARGGGVRICACVYDVALCSNIVTFLALNL